MTGVNVSIDDAQVVNALNQLLQRSTDLSPALRDIGEMLDKSHDERFDSEVSAEGDPWPSLTQNTVMRKKRNSGRVLTEYGRLRESLHYDVSANTLRFGTNVVYAAVHQFGADKHSFKGGQTPWGNIPARPFLFVSADDQSRMSEILIKHLEEALL